MNYKMIFFDIDGTLFSHKSKSIPSSTIDAINTAKKNGYKICVASGRSNLLASFTGIFNQIDFDYFVVTNGTLVLDKNNKIIYSAPLSKQGVEEVISLVKKFNLNMTYMTLDNYYMLNKEDIRAHLGYDPLSIPLPKVKQYQNEDIYQINLFCEDEYFINFEKLKNILTFSRLNHYGYDVYTLNHNKATGIEALINYLNIKKEEIISFGDGHNDEEMITFAGLGIAMGNAIEKVKNAADYITSDIDDDGIYKALKHFNII